MVEPGNCWDAIPNGVPEEEEFDNILNILDFPLESLEDDGFVADWDISKSHCLGPIPSSELIGPPSTSNTKVDSRCSPHLSTGLIAPIVGAQEQKQQLNLASTQESSSFHSQSPVSVLESSGSCSASRKNPPAAPSNPIPVRARSKRPKRDGRNPWLSASSHFTSTSKWASKDKLNKKKPQDEAEKSVPQAPPSCSKKCTHCEITKTPQWREGPLGPKTLCNACGVRYRSGRLFPEYRPAASPTFVPTLHSNSHKKVIEMRNKGKKPKVEEEEEPLVSSPQPEFVPMSNYLFDYIY
ncbi:GATA transcription factor 11 [Striga hermonthica]|uniref:GATA transcription factor 11 n=1 Tax=Striga hermonthica TaxID=68872 RepID=A0A9N7R3M7_STRHE|nr:GATA transcription factor 11 [Striga hermonthica]